MIGNVDGGIDRVFCSFTDTCYDRDTTQIGSPPGGSEIGCSWTVKMPLRLRYVPWVHLLADADGESSQLREHLMDARRMSDGAPVYIKRVRTGDNESEVARLLWSEAIRQDPRNHSVPVLDLFQDDEDPNVSYMIMPFLRLIDRPAMVIVEELCDFIDQILEVCRARYRSAAFVSRCSQGLVFMHEQGVAHR